MKTKKYLHLIIFYLLTTSVLFGQELGLKINGEYKSLTEYKNILDKTNKNINENRKKLFDGLNKKNIKTGFLIDQLIFSKTDLLNYSKSFDTSISSSDWKKIYNLLYLSQYKSDFLSKTQKIKSKITSFYTNGNIPIGFINIDYNKINEKAIENNLIKFQNNKLFDYSNSTNSGYLRGNVKALAPLISSINNLNPSFYLPKELFFTNNKTDIISIKIDFGDGFGFRKINVDEQIDITYTKNGIKNVFISLICNGKKYLFNSKMTVIGEENLKSQTTSSRNSRTYQDPEYIKSLSDGSRAYIEYGCNSNSNITKPFVFVEGINFSPPDDCPENNLRHGTFGWDVFRSGLDLSCAANPLKIAYLPELITKLKSEGFDIILLDFNDGADSIEHNADILIELINWINTNLSNNNSNNKLTIAGASMGGIVTRFALSKMEQTNQNHNTRLYLSLDAPHNGANIPLGDQKLLAFFSSFNAIVDEKPELLVAYNNIQKMATKQLLNYHSQSDFGISSNWHQDLISHPYYQFPQQPYCVGISNGSKNVTGQGFLAGAKMVDIDNSTFIGSIRVARIQGEPYAISTGNKFFWGKVYIFPNVTEVEYTCISNCKTFDSSPGSIRYTNQEIGQGDEIYPHHCFIPTISSLALNTENLSYNISNSSLMTNYPYIRSNSNNFCPFDMIYLNSSGTNEGHVETTFESILWLSDKVSPENLMLQNRNLDGKYEARNTIVAGKDIFSSVNSPDIGDVNVFTNSNTELEAGESIVLKNGFTTQNGTVFSAIIDDFCLKYDIQMLKNTSVYNINNKNLNTGDFIFDAITNNNLIKKVKDYTRINLYPNPSSDKVTIEYFLKEEGIVSINLFTINGMQIKNILNPIKQEPGNYKININVNKLPKGVYTCVLKTMNTIYNKKLIVK